MENVLSLIPQKPPFVMIDKLLYSAKSLTRCSFHVTEENIFTVNNEFSEAGLMENIAQTAAAGAGNISLSPQETPGIGYIGAVKNLEIFFLPKVNDELVTEIKILEKIFEVTLIEGKIFCREELIASCEMKIFIANKMADQL